MFNYQGRVMVQGWPYTGTGRMKVAILATSGTTVFSLWSNDGSSIGGSEPSGSFGVNTTSGVFDVMIGDTSAGMASLPAVLFNRDDELKVRVWFNDGAHGYQQLTPDRRLTNPRRYGLTCVTAPLTVYVNASDGHDYDNGLTTDTAKRTVQCAIDMLPRSIYATTTVKLAPGAYAPFTVNGFNDVHGLLDIVGDPTHDPTALGSLNVTVTGTAAPWVSGIVINRCNNVRLTGILSQNFWSDFEISGGSTGITILRCKATNAPSWAGFYITNHSSVNFDHSYASGCGRGYDIESNSVVGLGSSVADANSTGLFVYWNSAASFSAFTIKNSTSYGILSRYNSVMAASGNIIFSGNASNTNIASGSGLY